MENNQFGSPQINELAAALAKAQAEMPIADLNKSNPFYKSRYADFTSIVQSSRPSLSKHGLSVTQTKIDGEESFLYTVLLHASGQFVFSKAKINPPKTDIQSISSYMTYLKRMCYAAIVGIVTGDEDDDAEMVMGRTQVSHKAPDEAATITVEQLEELEYELANQTDICKMVLEGLQLKSLSEMPKSKFLSSINRIREIKRGRLNAK